jgi:hypothetical protein
MSKTTSFTKPEGVCICAMRDNITHTSSYINEPRAHTKYNVRTHTSAFNKVSIEYPYTTFFKVEYPYTTYVGEHYKEKIP